MNAITERRLFLKIARMRAGLTQKQLADQCGVSEHFVTRLETGRAFPNSEQRAAIAAALKIRSYEVMQ